MKNKVSLVFLVLALVLAGAGVAGAAYDFGGATVRISGTFPDDKTFGINFEDARGMGHVEEVEEMFNCQIEWVNDNSPYVPETFVSKILAGEPVADIQLLCRARAFFQIASEGLLMPLNDFLDDEYWANKPLPYQAKEHFMFKDQLYGFSVIDVGGWAIFWNKDFFAREGMPNPYDLIEQGEWTWETLRELGKMATKDTDGDGEIDQWGFYFENLSGGIDQFGAFLSANNAAIGKLRDGEVVFTLDEPEAVEAIEFMRSLIFEDKTLLVTDYFYEFLSGNFAMVFTHPWWFFYAGDPAWMEDDAAILPYPAGPNGDPTEINSYSATGWNWCIPITTEFDPRALVELYDALYMATYDYIIDDPTDRLLGEFAQWVTDRRDLEIYQELISNLKLSPYFNNFFFPDYMEFFGEFLEEGTNVEAHIASIKDVIQTRFDEVFNK